MRLGPLEPIAVMVDRTAPGEDTEAELMLAAFDDHGGCTLSLDDGITLDMDPAAATELALAILSGARVGRINAALRKAA